MLAYQASTVSRRKLFQKVAANTNAYDVRTTAGSPTDQVEVYVTVNSGVTIGDVSQVGYGLRTGGSAWNSGALVRLTNLGTINGYTGSTGASGANGNGGNGGASGSAGLNGTSGATGLTGSVGGPGLVFNVRTYVDNGSGTINGGTGGNGGPGGHGGGGGGGGGVNG